MFTRFKILSSFNILKIKNKTLLKLPLSLFKTSSYKINTVNLQENIKFTKSLPNFYFEEDENTSLTPLEEENEEENEVLTTNKYDVSKRKQVVMQLIFNFFEEYNKLVTYKESLKDSITNKNNEQLAKDKNIVNLIAYDSEILLMYDKLISIVNELSYNIEYAIRDELYLFLSLNDEKLITLIEHYEQIIILQNPTQKLFFSYLFLIDVLIEKRLISLSKERREFSIQISNKLISYINEAHSAMEINDLLNYLTVACKMNFFKENILQPRKYEIESKVSYLDLNKYIKRATFIKTAENKYYFISLMIDPFIKQSLDQNLSLQIYALRLLCHCFDYLEYINLYLLKKLILSIKEKIETFDGRVEFLFKDNFFYIIHSIYYLFNTKNGYLINTKNNSITENDYNIIESYFTDILAALNKLMMSIDDDPNSDKSFIKKIFISLDSVCNLSEKFLSNNDLKMIIFKAVFYLQTNNEIFEFLKFEDILSIVYYLNYHKSLFFTNALAFFKNLSGKLIASKSNFKIESIRLLIDIIIDKNPVLVENFLNINYRYIRNKLDDENFTFKKISFIHIAFKLSEYTDKYKDILTLDKELRLTNEIILEYFYKIININYTVNTCSYFIKLTKIYITNYLDFINPKCHPILLSTFVKRFTDESFLTKLTINGQFVLFNNLFIIYNTMNLKDEAVESTLQSIKGFILNNNNLNNFFNKILIKYLLNYKYNIGNDFFLIWIDLLNYYMLNSHDLQKNCIPLQYLCNRLTFINSPKLSKDILQYIYSINDKLYSNLLKSHYHKASNSQLQINMKYESIISGLLLVKQNKLKSSLLCNLFLQKTYLLLTCLNNEKYKNKIDFTIKMTEKEEENFFEKKDFSLILNESYDIQESLLFSNSLIEVYEYILNEKYIIMGLLKFVNEEIIVNKPNQLNAQNKYLKCMEILEEIN